MTHPCYLPPDDDADDLIAFPAFLPEKILEILLVTNILTHSEKRLLAEDLGCRLEEPEDSETDADGEPRH